MCEIRPCRSERAGAHDISAAADKSTFLGVHTAHHNANIDACCASRRCEPTWLRIQHDEDKRRPARSLSHHTLNWRDIDPSIFRGNPSPKPLSVFSTRKQYLKQGAVPRASPIPGLFDVIACATWIPKAKKFRTAGAPVQMHCIRPTTSAS